MNMQKPRVFSIALLALACAVSAHLLLYSSPGLAQSGAEAVASTTGISSQWGMIAAALATGLSSIGAAIAVARVGSAAVGVLAEKPEMFGRLLIMVGLAEGIAIYGLIVSILILDRLG